MALTPTFNGTRVNDSNSATNWARFQAGGGAPASEAPLAYQGGLAVNVQVKATTSTEGVSYDHSATASFDMTAAANRLWFVKLYLSDSFTINATRGLEVGVGSDSSNYDRFVISGSQALRTPVYAGYPARGGYVITAIAPSVSSWQDANVGTEEGPVGTADYTAVDWFYGACRMATGSAKSENFAVDSIDIGTGLTIYGDNAGDFTYKNFYYYDQNGSVTSSTFNNSNNRWGVSTGSGDAVIMRGKIIIGDSAGTNSSTFSDSTSVVTWPDGYSDVGLNGTLFYCNNASDSHTLDCLLISEGQETTVDTRADIEVAGTVGAFTCAGTINNFRNATFTAAATLAGANIQCKLLTANTTIGPPGFPTIGSSTTTTTIRTNSAANEACVQDFPDSNSTKYSYIDFVQTGLGHAAELSTVGGSYQFTNLSFTGYNASNNQTDSAIYVSASTGTTTINLSGTNQPSYRTAGATVTFVSSVSITVSNMVANTELRIYNTALSESDANYQIAGVEDVSKATGDTSEENGTASGPDGNGRYSFNFSTSQNVNLKLRFINTAFVDSAYWIADDISVNSGTDATLSIQAAQRKDRVFSNPV